MTSRKRTSDELQENPQSPSRNDRVFRKATRVKKQRGYDDSTPTPNIMEASPEDRKRFVATSENPYGWPKEYLDIYLRERNLTNPSGFEGLMKINDVPLFEKLSDQMVAKTRIQQFRNYNCIKSRHTDYFELEDVKFGDQIINMLETLGINYVGEFEEFFERRKESSQEYKDMCDRITLEINKEFDEKKRDKPKTDSDSAVGGKRKVAFNSPSKDDMESVSSSQASSPRPWTRVAPSSPQQSSDPLSPQMKPPNGLFGGYSPIQMDNMVQSPGMVQMEAPTGIFRAQPNGIPQIPLPQFSYQFHQYAPEKFPTVPEMSGRSLPQMHPPPFPIMGFQLFPTFDDLYERRKEITNRICEYEQQFEQHIFPEYEALSKNQPNKYRIIVEIIKHTLGPLAQYVCIAGGFALSMYIYETYGYSVGFGDIDLFIHSCDQGTANLIASKLGDITGSNVYTNENVLLSYFNSDEALTTEASISCVGRKHLSIQVIKRLYTCPSQVIRGFDVDCCCILSTLDCEIFITERGAYSVRKGYNMVNFDRLSPSFEYRLVKYNKRGFGIWIPFSDYFKKNVVFNRKVLDHSKTSSIIISSLMANFKVQKRFYRNNLDVSDYMASRRNNSVYNPSFPVQFKTLNPGEQISNTFNKLVLDDIINWYPKRPELCVDSITVNQHDHNECVITDLNFGNLVAMNIIDNSSKSRVQYDNAANVCRRFLNYLNMLIPGSRMSGGIVKTSLTGIPSERYDRDLKIFNPSIELLSDKNFVKFQFEKFYRLSCITTIMKFEDSSDLTSIGRVVFLDGDRLGDESYDFMTIDEDDSYQNYNKLVLSDKKIVCSYMRCDQDANSAIIPTSEFHERVQRAVLQQQVNANEFNHSLRSRMVNDSEFYNQLSVNLQVRADGNFGYNYSVMRAIKNVYGSGFTQSVIDKCKADGVEPVTKIYYNYPIPLPGYYHNPPDMSERPFYIDESFEGYKTQVVNASVMEIQRLISIRSDDLIRALKIDDCHLYSVGNVGPKIIFVDEMNPEFRDLFTFNGSYYSNHYEEALLRLKISTRDIADDKVRFFDGPAWEQFFPTEESTR